MSNVRPFPQKPSDAVTAGQKLAAIERVTLDPRASHFDLRVFCYLCSVMDRTTGIATRKQKTIAEDLKHSVRAVQISLDWLASIGCVKPMAAAGGTYIKAYQPILEKTNGDSSSIAEEDEHRFAYAKKRRTFRSKKANFSVEKDETAFVHESLSLPIDIPSRGRARASANTLGAPGEWLRHKHGDAVYGAWFEELVLIDQAGETIKLQAPTPFKASRVRDVYGDDLLAAFQDTNPMIVRVDICIAATARGVA